jgi:hypothetical protein
MADLLEEEDEGLVAEPKEYSLEKVYTSQSLAGSAAIDSSAGFLDHYISDTCIRTRYAEL